MATTRPTSAERQLVTQVDPTSGVEAGVTAANRLKVDALISDVPNRSAFVTDQGTVAIAGTVVQAPAHTVPDGFSVVFHAKPGNKGNIFIGESAAQAQAHNYTLRPGDLVREFLTNTNLAFFDAANSGDGFEITVEQ